MLIGFIRHLRVGDPPSPSHAAADSLVDGYVAWRETRARVKAAYERWARSEACDRGLAFAAYVAALEHEEHAARVYERSIERVRRCALEASNDGTPRAA